MRRIAIIILTFAAFSQTSFASDWQTFTNMNYVWEVLSREGKLWCATSGGVAALSLEDESAEKFTNVDGLGGNQIFCVAPDTSGNLWFGAGNGTLTKFRPGEDSWRVYIIERDKKRLKVKDIASDLDRLWIASGGVVSLFLIEKNQGEIKETYERFGEILPDSVSCISVGGGRVWVGTNKGMACARKDDPRINLQDPTSWSSFSTADSVGLTVDFIRSLGYFQDTLYLGTEDGVFKFIQEDSSFEKSGLGGLKINDLEFLNGRLTAATNNGVYFYAENRWSLVPWEGMSARWINSLDGNASGDIWCGTAGMGISSYGGETWSNFPIDGPPGNTFKDLAIDQEGKLWCANYKDEASSFDGTHWVSYRAAIDSIVGSHFRGMVAVDVDQEGNVWFGGWEYGIFEFLKGWAGDSWLWFNHENSPLSKAIVGAVVNDIDVDDQDNKWFCNAFASDTARILVLSPDSQWVAFTSRDSLLDNIPNQILVKDNHLWACFQQAGLCDYDYNGTISFKGDDRLKWYGVSDGLTGEVKCVNVDKKDDLWVGTSEGLFRSDPFDQTFEKIPLPTGVGPQVNFIVVDQVNNKWIATIQGLAVLNDFGLFTDSLTTDNSKLCHDLIWSLAIDEEKGEVWIGTDEGLSKYTSHGVSPSKSLSDIIAYPNPVVIRTGEEMVGFLLPPFGSKIKVFTVAGDYIREITSAHNWKWDLRNESGELISSGIYLFLVYDEKGNSWVGKMAVIRE